MKLHTIMTEFIDTNAPHTPADSRPEEEQVALDAYSEIIVNVARHTARSVVNIRADRRQQKATGRPAPGQPLATGSGFFISSDGFIVTNHHVINQAREIMVTLPGGKELKAAVKGYDAATDLAVLKLGYSNCE